MKSQHYQRFTLSGLLLVFPQTGLAENVLAIDADVPEVAVAARPANANFFRLPDLTWSFNIHATCASPLQPLSLLISVADTRKSITANDINTDGATEVSLKIPARQIAPIAIKDFCRIATDEKSVAAAESSSRKVPAVLSAQASMRCAGPNPARKTDTNTDVDSELQTSAEKTLYASFAMDVTLVCERPESASGVSNR